MAPHHLILKKDLQWVPCGDLKVGDEIIAFDEFASGIKDNGHALRRKWRIATITASYPAKKECVRVHIENGDSIVCSTDHPWLSEKYSYGSSKAANWVSAIRLPRSPYVFKQLSTWKESSSYEAGWLAGMFDGEGSLSFGEHGSPKLQIAQALGPIFDLAVKRARSLGYECSVIERTDTVPGAKPLANLYINGGFPGILRALGELRPTRLLSKLDALDMASRVIQPEKQKVVAVERVGVQDIQGIETSTGTYIGEGYLMHNTYGNRMADTFTDDSRRNTYTAAFGFELHPNNAGRIQWGARYCDLHRLAWGEAVRVLKPGGLFLLNISDHIRDFQLIPVAQWHRTTLAAMGLVERAAHNIETPRNRLGENHELRADCETVFVFEKP